MKKILMTISFLSAFMAFGEYSAKFINAMRKGADTSVEIRISDDDGSPVSNATVHVCYNVGKGRSEVFGKTNESGVFLFDRKTNGYGEIYVTKDGFYNSASRFSFIDMGNEHDVNDGKWQPYDGDEYIALRRILSPKPLVMFNKIIDMPSTNVWIGFDMKRQSFVSPHGIGEESDFEVYVEWDGLPAWESKYCNAKIRFASPFCGGYYVANVSESRFPYPYRAEMPNTFQEKNVLNS